MDDSKNKRVIPQLTTSKTDDRLTVRLTVDRLTVMLTVRFGCMQYVANCAADVER